MLLGPPDTPYEDEVYIISLHFPSDYPYKLPFVRFLTPIYHPNINEDGMISLEIPRTPWLTVTTIMINIRELLKHPNADDPLMPAIARELETVRETYKEKTAAANHRYAQ